MKPGFDTDWHFPNRATPLGSSAYYSVRFAPPALRDDIALLFAWRDEMQSVLRDCSDPLVARRKLQWWREELERSREGNAQHPLTQALAPVARNRQLPMDPFLRMADAAETDAIQQPRADLPDLEYHCEQDQGSLFELIAYCDGPPDASSLHDLRRLGAYCGLVYLIRDFGAHLHRGYNPLPGSLSLSEDRSSQADVDRHREALRQLSAHTRQLIADLHPVPGRQRSKRAFHLVSPASGDSARRRAGHPTAALLRSVPPSVAVQTAILSDLLYEIQQENFAVLDQRIRLTPLRKLWIGWRASRRNRFS